MIHTQTVFTGCALTPTEPSEWSAEGIVLMIEASVRLAEKDLKRRKAKPSERDTAALFLRSVRGERRL